MGNLTRVSPNLLKGLSLTATDGAVPIKAGNSLSFTKTLSGYTIANSSLSSPTISGGSINNTPIGATTRQSGAFTTLAASGASTLSGAVSMGSTASVAGNTTLGTDTANVHTINGSVNVTDDVTAPFLNSTTRSIFSGTQTTGMATATGSQGGLEVRGNGTGAAFLAFHRPGSYAAYLGIDTDNQLKVGGWSMGASAYPILYAGSTTVPGTAPVYAVRAWANFDGSTTAATLRGAGNIIMTYLSTGSYRATMTVPMKDANYAVIPSCNGSGPINSICNANPESSTQFTISIVYRTGGSSTVRSNNNVVCVAVIR